MLALKLSSAASLCTKPCKFPRSPIPSTTGPLSSPSSLSLVSFNVRRLAHLALHNCNPNNAPNKNNYRSEKYKTNNSIDIYRFRLGFGFRGRERSSLFFSPCFYFSSSSSSSSSSPNEPDPLSRGSGGGFVADDMNKVHDDVVWHGDGQVNGDKSAPSPSPSPSRKHQRQNPSHSKLLTLPTVLTLGRVAAVPLLVATFYVDSWWGRTATMGIFITAAVTDWLDGYLARKMRLGSAFGAFLDPVADKLMVAASLVLLCTRPFEVPMFGHVPWLLTIPSIVIIGREITMSAVREWAASQDSKHLEAVAVNNLGKWKTATQMIALTILLATRDSSLGAPGVFAAFGVALLYISAGLSVWSLSVYIRKIWRVLLK